jgi:hypothetical protein
VTELYLPVSIGWWRDVISSRAYPDPVYREFAPEELRQFRFVDHLTRDLMLNRILLWVKPGFRTVVFAVRESHLALRNRSHE